MSESKDSGGLGGTVVVGTYDGGLLGLHAATGAQTFGYAPHVGCVKAVACSPAGRCASGGTDHTVRLFDIAKGVELGELQEHDDTVCCLEFYGSSNLVTGGVDGLACVWRCSDWELLLKFRAHKAAMSCLAVHPSGRLMASAARDSSLRLWDLMRGTSAAIVPVEDVVESLMWSPAGDRLCALSVRTVSVVDVGLGGSVAVFCNPAASGLMRINLSAAMFLRDDSVVLGDAKGELQVLRFTPDSNAGPALEQVCKLPSDDKRVRIKTMVCNHDSKDAIAFAVGTSSGRVEVWQFAAKSKKDSLQPTSFSRVHVIETAVRLTCMMFWSGRGASAVKANSLEAAMDELEDLRKAELDLEQADSSLNPKKKRRRKNARQ